MNFPLFDAQSYKENIYECKVHLENWPSFNLAALVFLFSGVRVHEPSSRQRTSGIWSCVFYIDNIIYTIPIYPYIYIYPMDPSTFLGSVWVIIWRVSRTFSDSGHGSIGYIYMHIWLHVHTKHMLKIFLDLQKFLWSSHGSTRSWDGTECGWGLRLTRIIYTLWLFNIAMENPL